MKKISNELKPRKRVFKKMLGVGLIVSLLLLICSKSSAAENENNWIGKKTFHSKAMPVKFRKVSYNLLDFFKNFNPIADADNDEKVNDDNRKLEEFKFNPEEMMGKSALILKREPFEFLYFEMRLFLVNPTDPTKAIKLDGPIGFLDDKEIKRNFADEVDGVEVEKLNADTYRIFSQVISGNGKFATSPRTGVWDYNLETNTIAHYDFGPAFAKDLEKTGHRDVIVYQNEFLKDHWEFSARVFSWNGKEWGDVSDKEIGFLKDFSKKGF